MEEYNEVYTDTALRRITEEFSHLGDSTYLDHAGTTLYAKSQVQTFMENLQTTFSMNPHTGGDGGYVEAARAEVLQFLQADPQEYVVIFNSGATSGLKTVGETFPWSEKSAFFVHAESHTSSVGVREYAQEKKANVVVLDASNLEEILQSQNDDKSSGEDRPLNLFCFPGMSNYNGFKFDLDWIQRIHQNPSNLVLLDAAALLATNRLDLRRYKPDFLVMSFYKMFGYPTGLGALVMKRESAQLLKKKYFGGGTVDMHTVREMIHEPRKNLEEYFEDGTSHFLGIQAISVGFRTISNIIGDFDKISEHTFQLAKYTVDSLRKLVHYNGSPVVKIYSQSKYRDVKQQGGIVNFNLLNSEGDVRGFSFFKRIAETENIIVRTGCFCNTGSCQKYLDLDDLTLRKNYSDGHVCGDNNDILNGVATGSIRVSYGYMSTRKDADHLINIIKQFFIESSEVYKEECDEKNKSIKVVGLYVYPVKSCRAMKVNSWKLTDQGLLYDRQWVIMEGSKVLTQKADALMTQICTYVDLERNLLILSFIGLDNLEVSLTLPETEDVSTNICSGKICGEKMEGSDCGNVAGAWLEEALGRPGLRLVRGMRRFSKNRDTNLTMANDSEILTLNMASIHRLQERIEDRTDFSLEDLTQRFRGNIVIEGESAFLEEHWTRFNLRSSSYQGDEDDLPAKMEVTGPCRRCNMIGIEQRSGEVSKEPLRSLATFKERNFCFGVHTKVLNAGVGAISVGDTILLEKS